MPSQVLLRATRSYNTGGREAIPRDVLGQWVASLSASATRSARQYAATLKKLYSKGSTLELVGLPYMPVEKVNGQPPGDERGLGVRDSEGPPRGWNHEMSLSNPVQFVPASQDSQAYRRIPPARAQE
ncbi:hypothetical protein CYMTET_17215 [Cymbomonas tetramitiformis]|uniref:Uncharacterized protein n=1 Tax=Cymbomonas tetramitiformis TaxID=36881 RepID=A0AAE0GAJ8_9CHLO|nr:hypothetical protein CYMTET_17215 [Cymbomonas tetramitiformis]